MRKIIPIDYFHSNSNNARSTCMLNIFQILKLKLWWGERERPQRVGFLTQPSTYVGWAQHGPKPLPTLPRPLPCPRKPRLGPGTTEKKIIFFIFFSTLPLGIECEQPKTLCLLYPGMGLTMPCYKQHDKVKNIRKRASWSMAENIE